MNYERFPIQLNNHTIALIHLFHKHDCLADLWVSNCEHYSEKSINAQSEAAQQLIAQLEDHWTPQFLMALREEINKKLTAHNKEFNTNF